MPKQPRRSFTSSKTDKILTEVFRNAHWRVRRLSKLKDSVPDLIVEAGQKTYAVIVRRASEGRRDRLLPLLSQAILEVQAISRTTPRPSLPIAVVAAPRISPTVAEHLKQFARRHAPKTGIGIIDGEGLREFSGAGLEQLNIGPHRRVPLKVDKPKPLPDLFSDLNQWMIKILLGQPLPEPLITIPRLLIRNASQLAASGNVSLMSASRLLNRLRDENFLDTRSGHLQLVRIAELLERWEAAQRERTQDIPARWIIKKGDKQFLSSVIAYLHHSTGKTSKSSKPNSSLQHSTTRCCVGVFAAASSLGFGFVRGVPPHLYMEHLDLNALQTMGLSIDDAHRQTDVYIRIPADKETIFRPAVTRDGAPVSDILQVWLDASAHPARGKEQAAEIRRRILRPLLEKRR